MAKPRKGKAKVKVTSSGKRVWFSIEIISFLNREKSLKVGIITDVDIFVVFTNY